MYIHVHMRMYVYKYMYVCICIYVYTHTYIYIYVYIYIDMYTYIHIHNIYIYIYMQASTHIHTYICNGQTIAPCPNLLLPKWHTSRPATFHKNEGELQQPCAHLPNVRPSSLVPWQPTAPKMPGTRMRLNFMDVVAPRSSTGWSRYRIN